MMGAREKTEAATTSCPLCGRPVPLDRGTCASACPLARGCRILCCPSCGYEFVEHSALAAGFGRLVRLIRGEKR